MKNNPKNGIFAFFAVFCIFFLSVCSNDGGSEFRTGWAEGRSIPYTYRCSVLTVTERDLSSHYELYQDAENIIFDSYEFYSDEEAFYRFEEPKYYTHKMYVISSMEELLKTLEEAGAEVSEVYRMFLRFDLEKYNASYFSLNILILWLIEEKEGLPMRNWIHSLTVNEGTLSVNVLRAKPLGSRASNNFAHFEIKVRKADIAEVTNVEMVTRHVGPLMEAVSVRILTEYFDKKLTVNDFDPTRKYFSEITKDYDPYHGFGNYRVVVLRLKIPGREFARAAVEYLKTLYFVHPQSDVFLNPF